MGEDGGGPIHVVFGTAAACSIGKALDRMGRRARVIGLPDDLSFGPIDPTSSELRRAWARSISSIERTHLPWFTGQAPGAGDIPPGGCHDAKALKVGGCRSSWSNTVG